MPVCDICCEELLSEAEMRTHILLSHTENVMACPFCSLSGVSYDELNFHINTAHIEKDCQDTSATVVDSGQKSSNDWIAQSPNSTRTSNVNAKNMDKVSQASPQSPSTGTSLSQGTSTNLKSPPPAAATANGAVKLVRTTQNSSNNPSNEREDGRRKSKQKRLSSPIKEGCFACPMCSLVCKDCFILQEHVELHLQDQAEGAGPEVGTSTEVSSTSSGRSGVMRYECPMCSLSCSSSSSLQEHVELHLEYGSASVTGMCILIRHSSEDLTLARKLQEEEQQKWREAATRREAEDFKKLQKQFGLDNSGGYRKQMERNMERAVSRGQMVPAEFHRKKAEMLESLASGVDDGRSKTSGLMGALYRYYQRDASDCAHVWLCAETDHYSSSEGDKGWGCGYRNFQMLLSSLHRMEQYNLLPVSVPSIPRVQALIEEAWGQGADPQGASHFNHRLQGTRAWIGATEIYAVLTSLSVKAQIMDFHKPTGPGDTHPRLFEWVKQYFSHSASRGARLPPKIVQTTLPPIYLQHQGHSRSIVGVEEKVNGNICLLLFDPGCVPREMRKVLSQDTAANVVRRVRKFPGSLKHRQYQVVAVEGLLMPEEKQSRILNSRTLCAEKIP
ncbi:zinc finger with UFM1-specific peptidase domain protein-like isoform X1 [Sinocyclocheilus grahami]|uniref:zinc finger with UFM1-specific peptidase domain protein-like isoform X1 n=1 Tax=Sinocyclocheilus grahami TaxID=75366 RepID=UPI0007AD2887|nr:PREDICTED: zinc finger with UFM1-specific peptidase domain protein-like isoform X1 [Sinocyclocheilus grahami]XP_016131165.1 PREDICTED: zinc finger with UFM1-specific peptidase domain protein-like isoform X1 [Sinocyclocheilus grahami]XP_016131166.1 PREDICTED: zinc finger with UFM1-specific peptidase domain protein-like isoform X1 [Sinocyclocheilus grahami]